jgi:hypothetical protein
MTPASTGTSSALTRATHPPCAGHASRPGGARNRNRTPSRRAGPQTHAGFRRWSPTVAPRPACGFVSKLSSAHLPTTVRRASALVQYAVRRTLTLGVEETEAFEAMMADTICRQPSQRSS